MDNKKAFQDATQICATLQSQGHLAVFAGGAVRDMLLQQAPHDYDIATSAMPDQVEALFDRTTAVGKSFGVIVVNVGDNQFDVCTLRKDLEDTGRKPSSVSFKAVQLEEDAKRRDLTINGVFFDPVAQELMDMVGGVDDINARIVRFIGNPHRRIEEDKLRALRAIRFVSVLGFSLEASSLEAVKEHAHEIVGNVSPERIKMELDKMLLSPKPSVAFDLLNITGILKHVLPELHLLVSSEHSPIWHSEGNPWRHSLMVLDSVRERTDDLDVLWGALLHDIGKATCHTVEDGKIKNNGHDKEGAIIAEKLLLRLKAPTKQIEKVVFIVRQHMRIKLAHTMKKSTVRKLKSEEHIESALLVAEMDSLNTIPADSSIEISLDWKDRLDNLQEEVGEILPKPLIGGTDLLLMGFPQGKLLGEILAAVSEEQLNGNISTADEARTFVIERYS